MSRRAAQRTIAKARLAAWERQLNGGLERLLHRRQERVLASLRTAMTAAAPPADAFDLATWDTDVTELFAPVAEEVMADVGRTVVRAVLGPGGDLPQLALRKPLDTMMRRVFDLGPRSASRLATQLGEGAAQGEGIDDLSARVLGVFDSEGYEAERIARTVVGATNGASLEAASSLHNGGVVELTKEWLSTDDDRTRPTHVDADGQAQPIDQPFEVGDSLLMYPGDPEGSDEEVIGCRCTVLYNPVDTEPADDAAAGDDEQSTDASGDAGTLDDATPPEDTNA